MEPLDKIPKMPGGIKEKFLGRVLFRTLLAGLAFFAALIILNRFDRPKGPAGYDERDLPASSLDAGNGAFWLLFLGEPESEGLAIEGKVADYRRLLSQLERIERLTWQVQPRTRPLGVQYWQKLAEVPFPGPPGRDWPGFLKAERERLTGLRAGLSVLLGRYERMIQCGSVADFGYRTEWDRSFALMSFVQATARFYAALALLDAQDGGWSHAVTELLASFRFGERLSAAAQSVFFYGLGRSLIETSLDGLAGLMYLPGCPHEVMASVFGALPPPSEVRFSARSALIGEFLWASERTESGDRWLQSELAFRELMPGQGGDQARLAINVFIGREFGPENYVRLREAAFDLFLQKNRTKGYFRDGLEWLLALDASPPFRWGSSGTNPPSFKGPNLWWLWNPSGKLLYESFDPARQKRTVERVFLIRALYDLVRISAGLHIDPEAAATSLDPFSGRPYRWDPDRGLLWSVGLDGKDDQGSEEADLTLPVRTVNK